MIPEALPHRVRRLRWQARAGSPADALALRSLLRDQTEVVEAVLEQVLAGLDSPGQLRHIGRLELPLGSTSLGQLRESLPTLLAESLAAVLPATLARAGVPTTAFASGGPAVPAAAGPAAWADAAGAGPSSAGAAGGGGAAEPVLTEAAHRRAALQHYLLHGHLPWSVAGLARDAAQALLEAAARELAAQWPVAGPPPAWPALRSATGATRAMALLRWLALLPEATRAELAQAFQAWAAGQGAATGAAWQTAWKLAVQALGGHGGLPVLAAGLAWQVEVDAAGAGPSPRLAAALLGWLRAQADITAPAGSPARAAWDDALARLAAPVAASSDLLSQTRVPAHDPAAGVASTAADEAGQAAPSSSVDRPSAQPAAAPGLSVPLAGLVLLHPYLARLFIGLGLYPPAAASAGGPAGQPRGPIEPQHLPRAAALLHWLATGQEAAAQEFETPVIKLLLGLDPEAPLPWLLPPLDSAARDEAEALLQAAIGHWSALRGTRPAGLRLSFLQRGGLLRRREAHWLLQVQPESFDLLLARLPWGLGWVKLPWMGAPLVVEWGTP